MVPSPVNGESIPAITIRVPKELKEAFRKYQLEEGLRRGRVKISDKDLINEILEEYKNEGDSRDISYEEFKKEFALNAEISRELKIFLKEMKKSTGWKASQTGAKAIAVFLRARGYY